jgi:hypothetical protein
MCPNSKEENSKSLVVGILVTEEQQTGLMGLIILHLLFSLP